MTFEDPAEAARFRSLIAGVDLFAHLGQESQDRLAATAKRRLYVAGEAVIEHGAVLESLCVVESGMLSASVPDRHGAAVEVARFGAGQYCGEMSMIRHERADAAVTAITDSHVWHVPHSVIGEVAEAEPSIMRELAAVVADRLSSTNLRFRQLRPGRAVACISRDGSPWAAALLGQVGWSASMHLSKPVLLVDLSRESAEAPPFTEVLPTVGELEERPELLARFEAFASEGAPALGFVSRGAGFVEDPARLMALLADVRRRYELVIVHLPESAQVGATVTDDLDAQLLIWEEDDDLASLTSVGREASAETVLLRSGPAPGLQGELRRFSEAGSATAIRIVPGGAEPMAGERAPDARGEPWNSIDWLARHLIQRKVGLALGGGGAKGYAHLGVVERLQAWGVPVDYVAGTSIGAPVAAAVADGRSMEWLRETFDDLFRRATRPTSVRLPWTSLTSSAALRRGFEQIVEGKTFDDVVTPVAMVAVDLYRREEVVFREGDPVTAMLASIAIPMVFPPVEFEGRTLVDGGLLNPVPITAVAEMGADVVIGVKLDNPVAQSTRPRPRGGSRSRWRLLRRPFPIVNTVLQTYEVMQWKITAESVARADVSIEPVLEGSTNLSQWTRGDDFVAAGRLAAETSRAEIKELLPWIE